MRKGTIKLKLAKKMGLGLLFWLWAIFSVGFCEAAGFQVTKIMPAQNQTIKVDGYIQVYFNRPLPEGIDESGIEMKEGTEKQVAFMAIRGEEEPQVLYIMPTNPLKDGATYEVILKKGFLSESKEGLSSDFSFSFQAAGHVSGGNRRIFYYVGIIAVLVLVLWGILKTFGRIR